MTDVTEITEEELTYCGVHPERETGLRCNKCGRYMCAQCAVSTSVGYRCRECVRQVDDKFFTGTNTDGAVIGAICGLGTGVICFIGVASMIAYTILASFFIGLVMGGVLAELAMKAVERRRARYSPIVAGGASAAGGLLGAMLAGFNPTLILRGSGLGVLVLIGMIVFLVYRRFQYK